jgi:uncharacterized membrane protein
MEKVRAFLKRKNIVFSAHRYGVEAMGAMALGLFCSLLIGTILNTIGTQTGYAALNTIGGYASAMSGPAMAIAIGYALQAPPWSSSHWPPSVMPQTSSVEPAPTGGPGHCHPGSRIRQSCRQGNPGDILVTPLVTILVGVGLAAWWAPAIGAAAASVGHFIMWATELQPLVMGTLVSVTVGIALTLPISSAAICAALGLTGLAGGAALAGCSAQMVGFAVLSFRDNNWGGFFAQGLGTSMLQMGNIVRNPRVWLPAILTSAITGRSLPSSLACSRRTAIASGMGTCGLVGPIGVYTGWISDIAAGNKAAIGAMDWLALAVIVVVLPAILTWAFGLYFRKIGWIREGDLRLG